MIDRTGKIQSVIGLCQIIIEKGFCLSIPDKLNYLDDVAFNLKAEASCNKSFLYSISKF